MKAQGLWAAHLPPEMGGGGFGQVKLGLMHEILGACIYAPGIFGNQAPDSGNAELIAVGGTEEQKRQWMEPLLAGELRSCFSMTEPGAGADPTLLTTRAVRDGDEWVINGHKWFSSNASISDFLIVMCLTNPDVEPYRRYSMIIVPTRTPGREHRPRRPHHGRAGPPHRRARRPRRDPLRGRPRPVREPRSATRATASRWPRSGSVRAASTTPCAGSGQSKRAFDMLCERSLSRFTHGSLLAEKQMIQDWIAESYAELQAARLLTLQAAWKMDQLHEAGRHHSDARIEIATIKFWGARVLYNVIDRAIQVHGSLGYTTDLPLESMYRAARAARIYDGPDEVHKVTVARQVLKRYKAAEVPTEHVPTRRRAAQEKFAEYLDGISLNS